MLCKFFLVLTLAAAAVSSLECAFEGFEGLMGSSSTLNVKGGVDKCESGDNYCATINNFNGNVIKCCSKSFGKMPGRGRSSINCDSAGCTPGNDLCCCEGNMCNGVSGVSVLLPIMAFGVARMFL